MIIYKTDSEIDSLKAAGQLVGHVLLKIEEILRPGVTTAYIDRVAEEMIRDQKAIPAFKGYKGRISKRPFPGSICVSINEEVVHGIPGKRILEVGDIVSIDVGVKLNGFYGDAARTFTIGATDAKASKLLDTTLAALNAGIDQCVAGNRLSDISHAIEKQAKKSGFTVVEDFVGHGIGRNMHEDPQVLNYGPPGQGPLLKKGMVLAIEPMVNEGGCDVEVLDDTWTVVTADRKRSAHFEDTVALSSNGPIILTRF